MQHLEVSGAVRHTYIYIYIYIYVIRLLKVKLTHSIPVVTLRTARMDIKKFHIFLTQFIYVFCIDLTTLAFALYIIK